MCVLYKMPMYGYACCVVCVVSKVTKEDQRVPGVCVGVSVCVCVYVDVDAMWKLCVAVIAEPQRKGTSNLIDP